MPLGGGGHASGSLKIPNLGLHVVPGIWSIVRQKSRAYKYIIDPHLSLSSAYFKKYLPWAYEKRSLAASNLGPAYAGMESKYARQIMRLRT